MLRVPAKNLKALRHAATFAVLPLVAVGPALAQGPNSSPVAPTPPTPPSLVTSTPDLFNVGDGGCVQQYNRSFSDRSQSALTADAIGLAAEAVGVTAEGVNLVAQEAASIADDVSFTGLAAALVADVPLVGTATPGGAFATALAASSITKSIALGAAIVGNISDAAGLASQIAAQVTNQEIKDLTDFVVGTGTLSANPGLPFCELTFTGTVTVQDGGVNVSGVSIFNDDVRVDANVDVSGDVTATQVRATQGISAHSGAITLGDPGLTTYFDGITLGGGALSGAGFGGLTAFTGDVSAIAIGNGARATTVNSLALGTAAEASGVDATAIGVLANAAFVNSAGFGARATATRNHQQVFGTASNTYTMPGLTTEDSKAFQSGLLEVATTDASGNLATDGGAIFKGIARVQAGVAVSMAIETPELATGENFGLRVGWGGFDSFESDANAVGVSAIGVLARNIFGGNNRLAVDVGAGWGWSDFQGYSQKEVIAGRAGLQATW